jgi:hypothetical protein
MVALALPNRMPVLPAQAMAPRLSQDEPPLLVEMALTQCSLSIGNVSCSAPSKENRGRYLASAAAYIQEHQNRCACDTFPRLVQGSLPLRVVKTKADESHTDNVNRGTTNGTEHTPCSTMMGPMLPALPLAHPTWASFYHKPASKPRSSHRAPNFPSMSCCSRQAIQQF